MTDFAAFILTHGRPDNVQTFGALRNAGYTGEIILIVDDEDASLEMYRQRFERVEVFSKRDVETRIQLADTQHDRRAAVIFARNACFEIARRLGIETFIQLDDDYSAFYYQFDPADRFIHRRVRNLDDVLAALVAFYRSTPFTSVAMMQSGDFIGGTYGKKIRMYRKAMNSFICSLDREFRFVGRVNEDVNTYVSLGSRGLLFGSVNLLCLYQSVTQSNAGGMTSLYQHEGTYAKSFYPVLFSPSSVRIEMMKTVNPRIHHRIEWGATVPKIVRAELRKTPYESS